MAEPDPLTDLFTLFAAPLAGTIKSFEQFRKGVEEFLRGFRLPGPESAWRRESQPAVQSIALRDLSRHAEQDALVEDALNWRDGVDIWVNNAGGLPDATPRYLTRTPTDRWDAQIALNLTAGVTQLFGIEGNGRITKIVDERDQSRRLGFVSKPSQL